MQIAFDVKNGVIMLRQPGEMFDELKRLGMTWDKRSQMLKRRASLDFLNSLGELICLPENIEAERQRLLKIAAAVDAERGKNDPTPIVRPPIKPEFKPYKHQIRAYNMAMLTFGFGVGVPSGQYPPGGGKGFGFLFEMGCGKTLTAIMTAGALYVNGRAKRLLIAAPASVCSVWTEEFERYADFKVTVQVLSGTKTQRLKALERLGKAKNALTVAVINYESIWREDIFEVLTEWCADMIICDESQRIKTHDAKQSKALHKLGDAARYKLILSGTPVQNNAIDLYSQYRFLDADIFGTNFYAFRNKYAIMGGFNNKQIIGYKDMDKLIKKEFSAAYRVTKAEALDLPEQVFEERVIELPTKAKALYDSIKKQGYAELSAEKHLTAATALIRLLRLQQFTGGFILPDTDTRPELVNKCKLEALEDIIEDYCVSSGKKLVVFCRFVAEISLIADMLTKKNIRFGLIYGEIKQEERGETVRDFQENPETLVFLAQIDTAGLGITLTAADTCVYYSVSFNYAAYSQSLARIHRIGQRNTCTYIHLICRDTIDKKVLRALAKKEDLAKTVVDNWKEYFK